MGLLKKSRITHARPNVPALVQVAAQWQCNAVVHGAGTPAFGRLESFDAGAVAQVLQLPIPPVLQGPGMVRRFPEIIAISGVTKVLVVTDKPLYSMGLLDSFLCALETNGIDAIVFDKVQPNPTFENVEDGLALYYRSNCQGVVAFGGGSVLDAGRTCSGYASADTAQRAFIAAGGPILDPKGMDPDGDGFVCGWDPRPVRNAPGL